MCHLILALPLLALPVFWLLPPPAAFAAYVILAGFAAMVYWQALIAMRRPEQNGAAGLVGDTGEVIGPDGDELIVRVHNELWRAVADEATLAEGDRIEIVGVPGKRLRIQRLDAAKRYFAGTRGRASVV